MPYEQMGQSQRQKDLKQVRKRQYPFQTANVAPGEDNCKYTDDSTLHIHMQHGQNQNLPILLLVLLKISLLLCRDKLVFVLCVPSKIGNMPHSNSSRNL